MVATSLLGSSTGEEDIHAEIAGKLGGIDHDDDDDFIHERYFKIPFMEKEIFAFNLHHQLY